MQEHYCIFLKHHNQHHPDFAAEKHSVSIMFTSQASLDVPLISQVIVACQL
jgi:hypothetical protein